MWVCVQVGGDVGDGWKVILCEERVMQCVDVMLVGVKVR